MKRLIRNRIPNYVIFPLLLLVGARLVYILAVPISGLVGYGDFPNFFQLARLPGWPYINFWVEFPPIFPFLNSLLYRITGGQETSYDYLLIFLLTIVDAINLYLFIRLTNKLNQGIEERWRIITYLVILIALSYTWWYFDSLAVLGMLLALVCLVEGRDSLSGIAIAFGTLVKLFPIVILVGAWRYLPKARALRITIISLAIIAIVYGSLWINSPVYTTASLKSQINKGSWETAWALIDGNLQTGNFGPYSERTNPEMASVQTRNPAVINPLITLVIFLGLGLFVFFQRKIPGANQLVVFTGFTLCLMFLWSPGWSPQWVLYLLPLILLSLPSRESILLVAALVLVNLLEWPVLLSRGLFTDLWITVITRNLILILASYMWYKTIMHKVPVHEDNKIV